jgi:hypothetical protein
MRLNRWPPMLWRIEVERFTNACSSTYLHFIGGVPANFRAGRQRIAFIVNGAIAHACFQPRSVITCIGANSLASGA